MLFSPTNYTKLKSRLRARYRAHVSAIHKRILKGSEAYQWMEENWDEVSEFSSVNWLFLKQLERLSYFQSLPENFSSKNEFTQLDDEVFEKWNQSEFAETFLKLLNKGNTVSKASFKTTELFDRHLVAFANRHILKVKDDTKAYLLQSSLGEYKKGKRIARMLETTLHLDGKELNLKTSSIGEMKNFSVRIEVALRIIKKFSPTSWDRFSSFTETIIPIKQEELVSYSHQDLPGYSMINLYHRDFVDLIDDLIHENGHHHLNYYLNLEKLIDEPLDNIYYSPWRRTLRPIRGIYHAYFTFFWAFLLFSEIASSKELDSIWYVFNQSEKDKIYWRAVEEYWMLEYSYHDLAWAYKKKLISKTGWKLIQEQRRYLKRANKKVSSWEKKIGSHKSELKSLKSTLKSAKKKYKK